MLALICFVGCSRPPTATEACAAYALAWCARDLACHGQVSQALDYGDAASCQARRALACSQELAAPGTGASPSAMADCSRTLAATSCASFAVSCGTKPGAVSVGGSCRFDDQCASGHCSLGYNAPCGICEPPARAGDSCFVGCGDGVICDSTTDSCVAPPSEGAACDRDHGCGPGMDCVGATAAQAGRCQPFVGDAGAACDPSSMMMASCDPDRSLSCDYTKKTCVESKVAEVGQPCGTVGTDYYACRNADCTPAATGYACVAHPAEGAPCDPTKSRCLWPAYCRSLAGGPATCALPDGAACVAGEAPVLTNPTASPTPDPFVAAPHDHSLVVIDRGGPLLASPELVTITYASTRYRKDVDAFGAWVVGSAWLQTVGAEYGIGAGTARVAHIGLADPKQLSKTELETFLVAKVADQTLPAPTPNTVYMVFLRSANTHFTGHGTEEACADFDGYHDSIAIGGARYAYAVVLGCPREGDLSELEQTQRTASHELIEAATDPLIGFSAAYLAAPPLNLFGEVGDLCEGHIGTEGGYVYQRVWSNEAWAAGGDPCVPVDPMRPFFSVAISPEQVHEASPGEVIDYELTGWSTAPVGRWGVALALRDGTFTPQLRDDWSGMDVPLQKGSAFSVPDAPVFTNGTVGHLKISVPADAKSGQWAYVQVTSILASEIYTRWPLLITIP